MWPRGGPSFGPGTDINAARGKRSGGLTGFVSFMKRKDAESAVRDMDGFDWGGSVLRVGWSKAVPVAAKPAYVGALLLLLRGWMCFLYHTLVALSA